MNECCVNLSALVSTSFRLTRARLVLMTSCEWCGTSIPIPERQGRPRRYCSRACQNRAHRERHRPLPEALTARARWTRRDGKRPITVFGAPASSTNSLTWSTFAAASRSIVGDGFGIMLGDGLGCIDLDGAIRDDGTLTPVAAQIVAEHRAEALLIEVSMSGGLHVFVPMDEAPGSVREIDGQKVETYSKGRFIAVTGRRWQGW